MAGRRRDRGGHQADRRTDRRSRARLVARWPADRVQLEPTPRRRPVVDPPGHPRRRRRDTRRDRRDPWSPVGIPGADVAPGRPLDRRARSQVPRSCRQPERHLGLRGRRERCDAERRSQPLGPVRPHAGLRDGQRRDPWRGTSDRAVPGWPLAAFQRADRRRLRAVAHRGRRWPAGATNQGTPLRLELARGPEPARPSPRDPDRLSAFDPDPAARSVAGRGTGSRTRRDPAASPP